MKNIKEEYTPIVPKEVQEIFAAYDGGDMDIADAISSFLIMRIKKHKPLQTARAAHTLLNKLDKLSGGRRDMKLALLDTAILHCWDSVYPLKPDELADLNSASEPRVVEDEGVTFVE